VSLTFVPSGLIQFGGNVIIDSGVPSVGTLDILRVSSTQAADGTSFDQIAAHFNSSGKDSTLMDGFLSEIIISGDSDTGHVASFYSQTTVSDTAVVDRLFGFYYNPQAVAAGATVTENFAFYSSTMVGNGDHPYFLWYDGGGGDASGGGVFRVNELGILAYYNPVFATYAPGAANFERQIIRWGDTGVFGTDDNAYIGVEVGGTGTNRNLNVLGAEVGVMTIPGTYGVLRAGGYKSSDGSAGATGTATAVNTLTVKNGLITNIA
jgi:hypothetical protein